MKLSYIVILFAILFTIILTCGCTQPTTLPSTSDASLLMPPTTPEPTFATVTHSTNLITPRATVAMTSTGTPSVDPITGLWTAENSPVKCQVDFAQDNTGSATCGPLGAMTYGISWQNTGPDGLGNTTYLVTVQNTNPAITVYADINSTGIMTASILPSNGYLVKNEG